MAILDINVCLPDRIEQGRLHFALKLVSVKFAALGFTFPTFSFGFCVSGQQLDRKIPEKGDRYLEVFPFLNLFPRA